MTALTIALLTIALVLFAAAIWFGLRTPTTIDHDPWDEGDEKQ